MSEQYVVDIIEDATGKVVRRMGPTGQREADQVARGASINLNHDAYSVRVNRVADLPEDTGWRWDPEREEYIDVSTEDDD